MRGYFCALTALILLACSQDGGSSDASKSGGDEPSSVDTGSDSDLDEEEESDSDSEEEDAEGGRDPDEEDTGADDTGTPIPDWVDPVVLVGIQAM